MQEPHPGKSVTDEINKNMCTYLYFPIGWINLGGWKQLEIKLNFYWRLEWNNISETTWGENIKRIISI